MLQSGLAELRQWKQKQVAPAHLFCDARGCPPHLGAVLFIDWRQLWCHMPAPVTIVDSLRCRRDNQIMGLQLLSISLGFSSFERELKGRHVVVHSDNTGAEVWALVCFVLFAAVCSVVRCRPVAGGGLPDRWIMLRLCTPNGRRQREWV